MTYFTSGEQFYPVLPDLICLTVCQLVQSCISQNGIAGLNQSRIASVTGNYGGYYAIRMTVHSQVDEQNASDV